MADSADDIERLEQLLDRYGADFDAWPDREARWARRLILAAPQARASLDAARRLEALLEAREAALAEDGALAARAVAAVMPALPARTGETRRWAAGLAAGFVLAAVLGGAFEGIVLPNLTPEEPEVAMLDSLLYGPEEADLR